MFFITHRNIFYWIIGLLSVACLGAILLWGLRFSIEFTGGTMIEIGYEESAPEKSVLESNITALELGGYSLRGTGDGGYILRLRDITEEEYGTIRTALSPEGSVLVEKRRSTIGPTIGEELKNKALVAIAIVVLLIVFYVAFAFRNVRITEEDDEDAPGVSSWSYGFISILVLVHDLLIPLGVFAVLGNLMGAEVDALIVTAMLTILGYSVNDTIVIFDRVRENVKHNEETRVVEAFEETVGRALSQTYARSINTSFTTLIVVTSLLVLGGSVTTYFALTLAAGILAGTYSSIALAAPLLVTVEKYQKSQRAKNTAS